MHSMAISFLENMTLIIAFMFLALKLKELIIVKVKDITHLIWLAPLIISLLSVFIMLHPLLYGEMRIDLRGVPLFFISYLGGWKFGVISILFPTWLRLELGGSAALEGIIQGILVPFLVGSLFHNRKAFKPPYTLINLKHMMIAFVVYQVLKSAFMIWTTSATLKIVLSMCIFETIAVLSIGIMRNDVTCNLLLRKELEFLSRHDTMTNLYNLRHFRNKVEKRIHQKKPFVIAMFDVDYFKKYNDTHGHPAGDAALRTIGQLLNDNAREDDVFARYGGEEFIICFSGITNTQTAAMIADRLRQKVEEYKFYGGETQPTGRVTISLGVSGASEGKTLDELIDEADRALYKAKKAGRNNTAING